MARSRDFQTSPGDSSRAFQGKPNGRNRNNSKKFRNSNPGNGNGKISSNNQNRDQNSNRIQKSNRNVNYQYNNGNRNQNQNQYNGSYRNQNPPNGGYRGQKQYDGRNQGRNQYDGRNQGQNQFNGGNPDLAQYDNINQNQNQSNGGYRGRNQYDGRNQGQNQFNGGNSDLTQYDNNNQNQNQSNGGYRGQKQYDGRNQGQNQYDGRNQGQNQFIGENLDLTQYDNINQNQKRDKNRNDDLNRDMNRDYNNNKNKISDEERQIHLVQTLLQAQQELVAEIERVFQKNDGSKQAFQTYQAQQAQSPPKTHIEIRCQSGNHDSKMTANSCCQCGSKTHTWRQCSHPLPGYDACNIEVNKRFIFHLNKSVLEESDIPMTTPMSFDVHYHLWANTISETHSYFTIPGPKPLIFQGFKLFCRQCDHQARVIPAWNVDDAVMTGVDLTIATIVPPQDELLFEAPCKCFADAGLSWFRT